MATPHLCLHKYKFRPLQQQHHQKRPLVIHKYIYLFIISHALIFEQENSFRYFRDVTNVMYQVCPFLCRPRRFRPMFFSRSKNDLFSTWLANLTQELVVRCRSSPSALFHVIGSEEFHGFCSWSVMGRLVTHREKCFCDFFQVNQKREGFARIAFYRVYFWKLSRIRLGILILWPLISLNKQVFFLNIWWFYFSWVLLRLFLCAYHFFQFK